MKKLAILSMSLLLAGSSFSQGKYFSRDGHIKFFSTTPIEDIEADNYKVTVVLDEETGKVEFSALIKSFEFEKALMEEHFNENYMESKTYPKALFKGSIKDFKAGEYGSETKVIAIGTLSIHGVSKEVEIPGTISKNGEAYEIKSKMMVNPEDYKIDIPKTVREKIAKEVEVTVEAKLGPLTK